LFGGVTALVFHYGRAENSAHMAQYANTVTGASVPIHSGK